jgi:hypothetical protein
MPSINIRPGVNVLSVLRHLNYKPWYALAEFVDNAIQSFVQHRDEIEWIEGTSPRLRVSIWIDSSENRVVIRDNAAGIHEMDFPRAFRAAEVPPDRTGLSEFGMGMKSAACWFAPAWSVRTSALGEAQERTISFDMARIVQDSLEELAIQEQPAAPKHHYTEIILSDVFRLPTGRTLGKIKDHLSDIYRIFIRQGTLELKVNGEVLTYTPPKILEAPFFRTPEAEPVQWLKDFILDFSGNRQIYGFAAIRSVGSTSQAGFALFRRNRLIQGSGDEAYRPPEIFGQSNSFVYQRLYGELHFKGFGVSHTKDGIQWDGLEEEFLERLRAILDEEPVPLLRQAREYRLTPKREELKRAAYVAVDRTASVISTDLLPVVSELRARSDYENHKAPEEFPPAEEPLASRIVEIEHGNLRWRLTLQTSNDPAVGEWMEIFHRSGGSSAEQQLGVRLSLAHPFTQRFSSANPGEIELLLRIAAALAVAETVARASGATMVNEIRRNFNELLRGAFSR